MTYTLTIKDLPDGRIEIEECNEYGSPSSPVGRQIALKFKHLIDSTFVYTNATKITVDGSVLKDRFLTEKKSD